MKNQMQLLLLLITLNVAWSCRKVEPVKPVEPALTEIEGRVTRFGTNEAAAPYPIMLVLYEMKPLKPFGRDYIPLDTVFTDSLGYFKHQFSANQIKNTLGDYYIIQKTAIPLHFPPNDWQWTGDQKEIKINQKQTINMVYRPYAWMRLHVKNVTPQPGDRLNIYFTANQEFNFYGPVDKQVIALTSGNRVSKPPSNLYRNGTWSPLPFEVYLPGLDTTDYYLAY